MRIMFPVLSLIKISSYSISISHMYNISSDISTSGRFFPDGYVPSTDIVVPGLISLASILQIDVWSMYVRAIMLYSERDNATRQDVP